MRILTPPGCLSRLFLQVIVVCKGMRSVGDGRRTAEDFASRYGSHPYRMDPGRFFSLNGFSQRTAHSIGFFPAAHARQMEGDHTADSQVAPIQVVHEDAGSFSNFLRGTFVIDSLCLPDTSPTSSVDREAATAMDRGFVTWSELQGWFDILPEGELERGDAQAGTDQPLKPAKVFVTGAFSRASFHGIRKGTKSFPWLTCLLCSIVRNIAPQHQFTTLSWARNVLTPVHRDSHNDVDSCNLVLPCSDYGQGHLWLEAPKGDISISPSGPHGTLLTTHRPCTFHPRTLHATMPWSGDRLILVAFHIRQAKRLRVEDVQRLCDMGFYPMPYVYANTSLQGAEANEDAPRESVEETE